MIVKFLDRSNESDSSIEIQPNGEGVIIYLFEDTQQPPNWVELNFEDIKELEFFLRQVREDYE